MKLRDQICKNWGINRRVDSPIEGCPFSATGEGFERQISAGNHEEKQELESMVGGWWFQAIKVSNWLFKSNYWLCSWFDILETEICTFQLWLCGLIGLLLPLSHARKDLTQENGSRLLLVMNLKFGVVRTKNPNSSFWLNWLFWMVKNLVKV